MRTRILLAVAALSLGLIAGATPATASPAKAETCDLTVTDFYMSIAMQTASAHLDGCNGSIDNIEMEWSASSDGPFTVTYPADYISTSSDGTRATGYFLDPEQRGWCRAKATAGDEIAYSPNAVRC